MCSDEVLLERPPLNPRVMVHAPSKVLIELTWLWPMRARGRRPQKCGQFIAFQKTGRRSGASDLSQFPRKVETANDSGSGLPRATHLGLTHSKRESLGCF